MVPSVSQGGLAPSSKPKAKNTLFCTITFLDRYLDSLFSRKKISRSKLTLSSCVLLSCRTLFLALPSLSLCAHRLLVERVFAQYMVPHNLETTERMKCLYYLYATLDPYAVK